MANDLFIFASRLKLRVCKMCARCDGCGKPFEFLVQLDETGDLKGIEDISVRVVEMVGYSLAKNGFSDLSVSVFNLSMRLTEVFERAHARSAHASDLRPDAFEPEKNQVQVLQCLNQLSFNFSS